MGIRQNPDAFPTFICLKEKKPNFNIVQKSQEKNTWNFVVFGGSGSARDILERDGFRISILLWLPRRAATMHSGIWKIVKVWKSKNVKLWIYVLGQTFDRQVFSHLDPLTNNYLDRIVKVFISESWFWQRCWSTLSVIKPSRWKC